MTNLNTPRVDDGSGLREIDWSIHTEAASACTEVGADDCCNGNGNCSQSDDCPIRKAQAATAAPEWFWPAAVVVIVAVGAASKIWPWGVA